MKLLKLSALSAAVMAASLAQAESFIDDSTFDIHLRNYYKSDKLTDTPKQSAWAQGISGSFKSGYFMGLVGLDLDLYSSIRLSGDKGKSNTGLLRLSGPDDELDKLKTKSYGKAGGAIKINLMDMATLKYGRMQMDKPLLHDNDNGVIPSLTEALLIEGELMGADLYVAGAYKHASREESGFENFGVEVNGKYEKHTPWTAGGAYNLMGVDINAAYGNMHSFGHQFYGDLAYEMPLSDGMMLGLGGQYGSKTVNSKAKQYAVANDLIDAGTLDDGKISFWGLKADLSMGDLSVELAYTDVDQPGSANKNGLAAADIGQWGLEDGYDDQNSGFMGYNASTITDFNEAGQSAWGVTVGYNLGEMIQGLNASVSYVDSDVDSPDRGIKDGTVNEYNLNVNYAVPMLEGLTIEMVYAKAKENIYEAGNEKTKTTLTEKRVIVKYDIAVF